MIEYSLWTHQEKAINAAKNSREGFAFFMDPGTGKTLVTIEVLRSLYNKNRAIIPTLILAPVIVLKNWKDEFAKFSKIDPNKILVLTGPVKARVIKLARAIKQHDGKLIVIINYDVVHTSPLNKELMEWAPRILVFDESHKIKTHNSKRSKACHALRRKADRGFLLSGTPVLNTPMDIFSQFLCLDKGARFENNFYSFRNSYFYDANAGMPKHTWFPNWQPRHDRFEYMNKLIYQVAIRAKKSDCLDLPPLLKKRINVELSPQQKRLYDSMEKQFIAFLDDSDDAVVAQLALTKTIRLRQIISGFVKTDKGDIKYVIPEPEKLPRSIALRELLEEITQDPTNKVIIWSVLKPEYNIIRAICEKLQLKFVEAHGGISDKKKFEAVDLFNNDRDYRVFLGHPLSLGIGINLVASSYSIYMSRDYSLEQRDQSEARNYRGGSEIHDCITHYDIVAEKTIDEVILEAIDKKANLAEVLLEWRKSK